MKITPSPKMVSEILINAKSDDLPVLKEKIRLLVLSIRILSSCLKSDFSIAIDNRSASSGKKDVNEIGWFKSFSRIINQIQIDPNDTLNDLIEKCKREKEENISESEEKKHQLKIIISDSANSSTDKFDFNYTLTSIDTLIRLHLSSWKIDRIEPAYFLKYLETILNEVLIKQDKGIERICYQLSSHSIPSFIKSSSDLKFNKSRDLFTLFKQQLETIPNDLAVISLSPSSDEVTCTYEELDLLSNRLANVFYQATKGKTIPRIGVYLDRSHKTYIALLAILRSGYIYVPLERSLPDALIAKKIKNSGVSIVITDFEGEKKIDQRQEYKATFIDIDEAIKETVTLPYIDNPRSASNISMIFFTSGSTGSPKGVVHTQIHLLNRLNWIWNRYDISPTDVICQRAPLNYLPSMWELFAGLLKGNKTVILSDRIVKDPKLFIHTLVKYKISWINIVPSLLNMLFASNEKEIKKLKNICLWIACGEKLPLRTIKLHRKHFPTSILLNDYGSTEVNGVLYFEINHNSSTRLTKIPAFKPIPNIEIKLLTKEGQSCNPYIPGELYVGGLSLAKGYLDKNITKEKFKKLSTSSKNSKKYFAMGDWGYQDADGGLHLIGRFDNVVKIRGNRISLDGLNEKIQRLSYVNTCIVLVKKKRNFEDKLACFVLFENEKNSIDQLKSDLPGFLPQYMIPHYFKRIEEIPHLVNGKIDRRSLLKLLSRTTSKKMIKRVEQQFGYQDYLTFCQIVIASVIDADTEEVNLKKKFYEVGLDSTSLVQLIDVLNEKFSANLAVSDLYDFPNMIEFLDFVYTKKDGDELQILPPVSLEDKKEASIAQEDLKIDEPVVDVPEVRNSDAYSKFLAFCTQVIADLLDVKSSSIILDKKFYEIGLDSASLVQLIDILNKQFSASLAVSDLYDFPNIIEFLDFAYKGTSGGRLQILPPVSLEDKKEASIAQEELRIDEPVVDVSEVIDPEAYSKFLVFCTQIIADLLDVKSSSIILDKKFYEIGLDSTSLVQFINELNTTCQTEVSISDLYDFPNILEFLQFVFDKRREPLTEALAEIVVEKKIVNTPQQTIVEKEIKEESSNKQMQIAIVGVACKLPGAEDMDEFEMLLSKKKSGIQLVPKDRWDYEKNYSKDPLEEGASVSKWGGFVSGISLFDEEYFNVSPLEAELMDPQQRLCLEESWKALQNAGYSEADLANEKVGVFIGLRPGDYQDLVKNNEQKYSPYSLIGSDLAIQSARLSYHLNLKGPSMAIDTACSSSLVAIHLASNSLRNGECNVALAGGIHIMSTPGLHIHSSKMGMLSPEGQCKTFSNDANGFVPGEGVGMLVLKPLENAIEDGNYIHGVIIGSGLNQDGKTNGITAPSGHSQSTLQKDVYEKFDIDSKTISYLEAHGTGTKLGDPIEIASLNKSFARPNDPSDVCHIGSVKTNIGHGVAAAGVAGLIKILLSFKTKSLFPNLNFKSANEHIDFSNSRFKVVEAYQEWNTKYLPRKAAINSFGFSGTNAHLVLEEFVNETERLELPTYFFVFSAKSANRLLQKIKRMDLWLKNAEAHPGDISLTLAKAHSSQAFKLTFIAKNLNDLRIQIQVALEKGELVGNNISFYEQDLGSLLKKEILLPVSLKKVLNDSGHKVYLDYLEEICNNINQGYTYDWPSLFADCTYRICPMQIHELTSKHFWLEEKESTNENKTKKTLGQKELNIQKVNDRTFKIVFSGSENFLTGHRYQQDALLPGTAYLFLTQQLFDQYFNLEIESLKNIVWLNPFFYNKNQELFITRERNDQIIFSIQKDKKETIVCRVEITNSKLIPPTEVAELELIKSRCTSSYSEVEVYNKFENLDHQYNTSFQTIKYLYTSPSTVLSFIELENTRDPYNLIYLLDGALQSVLGFNMTTNMENASLPFSIKAVKLYSELPKKCWVYVQPSNLKEYKNTHSFHIEIYDEEGCMLAQLEEFVQLPFQDKTKTIAAIKNKGLTTIAGQEQWILNSLSSPMGEIDLVLLFGFDEDLVKAIEANQNDQKIILIRFGEHSGKIKERVYEIQRQNYNEDYELLIERIKSDFPAAKTVGWMMDWRAFFTVGQNAGYSPIEKTFQPIAFLKKVSTVFKKVKAINFIEGNISSDLAPFFLAYNAFARTFNIEYPEHRFINLRFEKTMDRPDLGKKLYAELTQENPQPIIKYNKKGERLTKELLPFDWPVTSPLTGRENGLYIITGGAGGLGLIFAEYLIKKYNAQIILLGRRKINDTIQASLDRLRQTYGSNAEYHSVDITSESQIKSIFEYVRNKWENIHGIIHSAGLLRDALLYNKNIDTWTEVLKPKIKGALLLDKYSAKDNLDWIVFCSSISSVIPNAGQTDYSYANSYLNHFAIERNQQVERKERKGRTLAINWPLWESGGMKLKPKHQEYLEKQFGIFAMPDSEGCQNLEKALSLNLSNVTLIYGKQSTLEQKMFQVKKEVPNETNIPLSSDFQLEEKVQAFIIDELAQLLKQEKQKLRPEKSLSEFGMDSILMNSFTRQLQKQLDIDLNSAILFEQSTIKKLVKHLLGKYNSKLNTYFSNINSTDLQFDTVIKQEPAIKTSDFSHIDLSDASIPKDVENDANEPMAIVGLSGAFPGDDDLETFFDKLTLGVSMISKVPKDRWDYEAYFGNPMEENKTDVTYGGFVKTLDEFDPDFFNISASEANYMDPQQRILLEYSWKAIEDAGYDFKKFNQKQTGVFIGIFTREYEEMILRSNLKSNFHISTGNIGSIAANRISYCLDLHGPSEVIDTACSSSLVALHRAIQAIRNKECNQAIIGGVNLLASPYGFIGPAQANLLTSEEEIKSFGEGAKGYLRGEGVGVVIIKPLQAAIADKDHIYATIKGSGLAHGGKGFSLTSPNPTGQLDAFRNAMINANIKPDQIVYVEAHGTGTALGDSIEMNVYKEIFDEISDKEQSVYISTIKPNIGHLEAASGMASLIKVLYSFQKNKICPIRNFQALNPEISLENTCLKIVDKLVDYQFNEKMAALHSFGFGGTNASIILDKFDNKKEETHNYLDQWLQQILVFSAKDSTTLHVLLQDHLTFLKKMDRAYFADYAFTLQEGRNTFDTKIAFIAKDIDHLKQLLSNYLSESDATSIEVFESMNEEALGEISQDESIKSLLLQAAITQKNTSLLAKLWVAGYEVEWKKLYHSMPYRISAPTYLFNKQRYWILDEDDNKKPRSKKEVSIKKETPEIINLSTTENEINNFLVKTCSALLDCDRSKLIDDANLYDLGLDSILRIGLKFEIEKYYNIELSVGALGKAQNLSHILELINNQLKKKEQVTFLK